MRNNTTDSVLYKDNADQGLKYYTFWCVLLIFTLNMLCCSWRSLQYRGLLTNELGFFFPAQNLNLAIETFCSLNIGHKIEQPISFQYVNVAHAGQSFIRGQWVGLARVSEPVPFSHYNVLFHV